MNVFSVLIIFLFSLMLSPCPVGAGMLSSSYNYDEPSGTFSVVLSGLPSPISTYNIALDLNYQASSAVFTQINFNSSSAYSSSSTNVNGQGEVKANAGEVSPGGGNVLANLVFKVQDSGNFSGVVSSLTVNGAEYGPLQLPTYSFGSDDSNSGGGENADPGTVPPNQVLAVAKNHASTVSWKHPNDGVESYRVDSHIPANASSGGLAIEHSCNVPNTQLSCTVRGLKNGVPVEFMVTAIYPGLVTQTSGFSNTIIPARLKRNGVCNPAFDPSNALLGMSGACSSGTLFGFQSSGTGFIWSCFGAGGGVTAFCQSPE